MLRKLDGLNIVLPAGMAQETGFRLGFTTLENEVSVERLPISGTIPGWLSGTLIRNGPAKFEVGERKYRHWFDGLGMLHKFSFRNGQVSYANRFLRSKAFTEAQRTGKIAYGEFATDPCRSIFARVHSAFSPRFTDNGNVNVTRLGNKFIAITETPLAVEFEPETLRTVGVADATNGTPGHLTPAHPHYDFERREALSYVTRISRKSEYRILRTVAGATSSEVICTVPAPEPAYMHSFGLTQRYFVLAEYPLVLHPSDLLLGGKPFIENFRWEPERGTNFIVVDRVERKLVGRFRADPFFAFHHVNAFESEGSILLDLLAYKDSGVVRSLYLDVLRGETPGEIPLGELRRYTIPLAGGDVGCQVITKSSQELPRINYRRCNTRDYRFVYGVGSYGVHDFTSRLVKADVVEGKTTVWSQQDCYPGEPVFVQRPRGEGEDDGLILSVVLDSKKCNSFLLVLDAQSLQEVGRAEVPHHIPLGFHGQYYGGE